MFMLSVYLMIGKNIGIRSVPAIPDSILTTIDSLEHRIAIIETSIYLMDAAYGRSLALGWFDHMNTTKGVGGE